jgi:hypothetical protein
MKLHVLWIIGIAAGVAACATDQNAGTASQSKSAAAQRQEWQHSAFIDHMHAHADYLDDLNYALDDGDLERAKIPAYWLSRHKTVSGLPSDLRGYVVGMRKAAEDVEAAEDLDTARAAAKRIGAACRACHTAAGVNTPQR